MVALTVTERETRHQRGALGSSPLPTTVAPYFRSRTRVWALGAPDASAPNVTLAGSKLSASHVIAAGDTVDTVVYAQVCVRVFRQRLLQLRASSPSLRTLSLCMGES